MGRIPPALHHAEILSEQGLPVMAVEYGALREEKTKILGKVPRWRLESPGARSIPLRLRMFFFMFSAIRQIASAIRRDGKPSVLVGHGLQEQILAYLLGRYFHIPFVVHVHEPYTKSDLSFMNRILFAWEGRCLRAAEFLVFPEKTRAEIYRKRYGLKNTIYLAYNSARLQREIEKRDLRALYQIPAQAKILGYLGGIGPLNSPQQAISALASVPDLYFVLWGWGEPDYVQFLQSFAAKIGVAERVKFLGELGPKEKLSSLAGCDISYCVYRWDQLREQYQATASNKLMESLACGVPVLTNSREDFKAVVEGYDVGVCAKSLEPADIAAALRELVRDELSLKRRSQNGRRVHLESLNFEHQFQPVLERYRRMLGVSRSPGRYGRIS